MKMQIITKAKYQKILLMMIDDLKSKSTTRPNDLKALTDAYEDSKSTEFEEVEAIHIDGQFTFKPILLNVDNEKDKASVELFDNEQAKALLSSGKKLTHEYFSSSEWVKGQGCVYVFEDGCSCSPSRFWDCREDFPPSWKIIE